LFGALVAPFLRLYLKNRVAAGLDDPNRWSERLGVASISRPSGRIIWIHAVSVGESLSVIPFIEEFKKINPDVSFLLTTTTIAASRVISERLGNSVISQFFPFDVHKWISRFIEFWNPCAAFFVESEIWPNTLFCLNKRKIPVYLLNARVSQRTLKRMHIVRRLFSILPFSLFKSVIVSSQKMADQAKILGAKNTIILPNMKMLAAKLPVDAAAASELKRKILDRKVWMACSSHKGEEEIILSVHKKLRNEYKDIITIIAPRHPDRSAEIQELCRKNGITCARHSELPESIDEVYILDAIGCLGEFFEAVKTVLVCGSLIPGIGGHNILEPLLFGCSVATGQYIDNFQDIYQHVMDDCRIVFGTDDIIDFINGSLGDEMHTNRTAIDSTARWRREIERISFELQ
jgi:3-deoxy-D-manno-octulosonic-acid transferase